MPFHCFYCLIALARNAILHRSGERRHPCLGPNLRGKAFSLFPLWVMLAVSFFVEVFYQVGKVPFYFLFVKVCSWCSIATGITEVAVLLPPPEEIIVLLSM